MYAGRHKLSQRLNQRILGSIRLQPQKTARIAKRDSSQEKTQQAETIANYINPNQKPKTPPRKMKSEATNLIQRAEWLQLMLDVANEAHISSQAQILCHQIHQALMNNEEKLVSRFGLQATKTEVQLLSWRQPQTTT